MTIGSGRHDLHDSGSKRQARVALQLQPLELTITCRRCRYFMDQQQAPYKLRHGDLDRSPVVLLTPSPVTKSKMTLFPSSKLKLRSRSVHRFQKGDVS